MKPMSWKRISRETVARYLREPGIRLSVVMLVLVFLINTVYVWVNGENLLDSDASSELVLASLLDKEHHILSRAWYYSTELRVLNTQLVYKLFLLLFPHNWHLARTMSIIVFQMILIGSTLYLAHAIGHFKTGILIACTVICPISPWYGSHLIYLSYYVPHIVITMLALGMLIKYVSNSALLNKGENRRLLLFMLALAFASSLGGIRQLMVCYAPLWIATGCRFLLDRENRQNRTYFLTATVLLGAGAGGFLVNEMILSRWYQFTDPSGTILSGFEWENVLLTLTNLARLYGGWEREAAFFGIDGMAYLLGLLLGGIVFATMIIIAKRLQRLTEKEAMFTTFTVALFFVTLITLSQISPSHDSQPYWILFLPFSFFFPFLFFESKKDKLLLHSVAVVFFCASIGTMRSPLCEGIPHDASLSGVASWLTDAGYTKGCASFWHSNILTELTSGQVEMWTIRQTDNGFGSLEIYPWLQVVEHNELPKEPFFLLAEAQYEMQLFKTERIADYIVYGDENYYVYGFDDAEQYLAIMQ